jgi:hypothetical protein
MEGQGPWKCWWGGQMDLPQDLPEVGIYWQIVASIFISLQFGRRDEIAYQTNKNGHFVRNARKLNGGLSGI